jgi:hypothetical protein
MRLMLWLGAYLEADTLGHTLSPLSNLWRPFWVDLGVPKWPPKNKSSIKKKSFPVLLNHVSQKNQPNDLVRSLFLSLDIEPYIPTTCRPLGTFGDLFGSIWGYQNCCEKTQSSMKNSFLVLLDHFS